MAAVAPTITPLETFGDNVTVYTWSPITTTNDYGSKVETPGWADRSIQIGGTFGSATVVLQGSNHASPVETTDADWVTLTDPQGNAISKTAAALEAVLELTRWIRPKYVSGGGGTTAVEFRLLVKR